MPLVCVSGCDLSVTSGDMLLLLSKVVFNVFTENHRQSTETCDRKELERDLQQGKPTSPEVVKAPLQQTRKGQWESGAPDWLNLVSSLHPNVSLENVNTPR